jgi:hypothetical protein
MRIVMIGSILFLLDAIANKILIEAVLSAPFLVTSYLLCQKESWLLGLIWRVQSVSYVDSIRERAKKDYELARGNLHRQQLEAALDVIEVTLANLNRFSQGIKAKLQSNNLEWFPALKA